MTLLRKQKDFFRIFYFHRRGEDKDVTMIHYEDNDYVVMF